MVHPLFMLSNMFKMVSTRGVYLRGNFFGGHDASDVDVETKRKIQLNLQSVAKALEQIHTKTFAGACGERILGKERQNWGNGGNVFDPCSW